jgi:hypothetical protein
MRRLYVLFIALCLTALPAHAQQDPIRKTIQSQLDAIAQDDYNLAFSFASSVIKEVFGDAATFEKMVRKGYPMVTDHRSVTMLELRTVAGNLWQGVMITDGAGRTHLLDYMMTETAGGWQISAVQLLPEQGVSA